MGKPSKIPIEQVRRVHEILEKAPDVAPEAVTTRAAIGKLCAPIARLKARGYSLQRIAEMLSANGIPITVETLSTYLTLSKRERRATAEGNRGGKSEGAERASRPRRSTHGSATERPTAHKETRTRAKAVEPPGKAEPGSAASARKRADGQPLSADRKN